jgi:hypothetical protein
MHYSPITRRKHLPAKKPKFVLVTEYSLSKYDTEHDSKVRGIVGRPEMGSGTNLTTGVRDLSFHFDDEKEAKKALKRLKDKGMRSSLEESA